MLGYVFYYLAQNLVNIMRVFFLEIDEIHLFEDNLLQIQSIEVEEKAVNSLRQVMRSGSER